MGFAKNAVGFGLSMLLLGGCSSYPPYELTPNPQENNGYGPNHRHITLITCAFTDWEGQPIQALDKDNLYYDIDENDLRRMIGVEGEFPSVADFYSQYGIEITVEAVIDQRREIGELESYSMSSFNSSVLDPEPVVSDCLEAYDLPQEPTSGKTTIVVVNGPIDLSNPFTHYAGLSNSDRHTILLDHRPSVSIIAHELGHEFKLGHTSQLQENGYKEDYGFFGDVMSGGQRISEDEKIKAIGIGDSIPVNFSIPSLYHLGLVKRDKGFVILKSLKVNEEFSTTLGYLYPDSNEGGNTRGLVIETDGDTKISIELRGPSNEIDSYEKFNPVTEFPTEENPAVFIATFTTLSEDPLFQHNPKVIERTPNYQELAGIRSNMFFVGDSYVYEKGNESYKVTPEKSDKKGTIGVKIKRLK